MRNTSTQSASRSFEALSSPPRKAGLAKILAGILSFALLHSSAQAVGLAWDANTEADIAGYRLYYGVSSGTYTMMIDTESTTSATVSDLAVGSTYFFAVTAYNTSGLESPLSNEVSVMVMSPANTAPTISDITDRSINQGANTGAIAFTIGDGEVAAGNLTVTGTSSNLALVPNANIVFGGSGASRTVTVTPAGNQTGTTTITVTVSDGAVSASDTYLLTVNAVNEAPTVNLVLMGSQFDAKQGYTLRIEGPPGKQYAVEASEDLRVWAQIGTILNNEGQSFFTDPNAPSYKSRFYRLTEIPAN